MPVPTRLAATLAVTLGLAACATTGEKPTGGDSGKVEGVVTRPLTDLGIVRNTVPEALAAAAAAPYAITDPANCDSLAAEIARLDAVLGPDLDVKQAKPGGAAGEILFDAFQGALDIPFRGAVRKITGAEKRDRARAAAVLAGMVRRAWLKGAAHNAGCTAPAPAP